MFEKKSGRVLQKLEHSIIAELEDAVKSGSSERRVDTLRQVTNLFLHDGDRLSEDQIKVFDDVLCVLISRVESRARAELSQRLAPIDYARSKSFSIWPGTMKLPWPAACWPTPAA